jgi:hypothetical protein
MPPRITRFPIYPAAFAAAFVLVQFGVWNAPVEALPRPLIVAILSAVAVQVGATMVLRDPHRGAQLATVALLLVMAPEIAALAIVAWIVVARLVAVRRRRGIATAPWQGATTILNGIAVAFLATSITSLALDGGFASAGDIGRTQQGSAPADAPDIYLLMLDGYPRADTLAKDFAYDNRPFLDQMTELGFDVATESHSNYPMTLLTLSTVFNGRQLASIVPDPPAQVQAQYRLLTRLINHGTELDVLRQNGYEIVSIPSEFTEAALLSADRVLDSGEMTTFEMAILASGSASRIPQVESLALDEHRARVFSTFTTLTKLAGERSPRPKLVFAHVVAPHPPIAFGRSGERPSPLACPVESCSPFSFGDEYGDQLVGPMRDQIGWLNDTVLATVRGIQAESAKPPVIVIFSDHGLRNDPTDRDEMFRSILLAATPGRPGVFPNDASPVNILPRLRNAYTGAAVPLASEESYWVDARVAPVKGLFPGPAQPMR